MANTRVTSVWENLSPSCEIPNCVDSYWNNCILPVKICQTVLNVTEPVTIVEVAFKLSSFLLINATNLCDQLEPVAKYEWGNILPFVHQRKCDLLILSLIGLIAAVVLITLCAVAVMTRFLYRHRHERTRQMASVKEKDHQPRPELRYRAELDLHSAMRDSRKEYFIWPVVYEPRNPHWVAATLTFGANSVGRDWGQEVSWALWTQPVPFTRPTTVL